MTGICIMGSWNLVFQLLLRSWGSRGRETGSGGHCSIILWQYRSNLSFLCLISHFCSQYFDTCFLTIIPHLNYFCFTRIQPFRSRSSRHSSVHSSSLGDAWYEKIRGATGENLPGSTWEKYPRNDTKHSGWIFTTATIKQRTEYTEVFWYKQAGNSLHW